MSKKTVTSKHPGTVARRKRAEAGSASLQPLVRALRDAPQWFFVWTKGQPYVTTICGWGSKAVQTQAANANCVTWRKLYREGGRVVRLRLERPNVAISDREEKAL